MNSMSLYRGRIQDTEHHYGNQEIEKWVHKVETSGTTAFHAWHLKGLSEWREKGKGVVGDHMKDGATSSGENRLLV
jgi:hypothetical protein